MATAEEGIRFRLRADSDVAAITTRGSMGDPPEDAPLPYYTLMRVDAPHEHHMGGASGWTHPRIQVDFYAKTWAVVLDLANKARIALDGFTGTVTVGAGNTVTFKQLFLENDNTDSVQPDDSSDRRIKRASHDYKVWIEESVPTPT